MLGFKHDLLEALNSRVALPTKGLDWSLEEVESLLGDVPKDIENWHVQAYVAM